MLDDEGNVNEAAMKIRITDKYIEALSKIYSEAKLISLPSLDGASEGYSSGMNTQSLATAMVLFQHLGGKPSGKAELNSDELQSIQQQVMNLKGGLDELNRNISNPSKGSDSQDKVRYLDSKVLY